MALVIRMKISLQPGRSGIQSLLGELELAVMEALWANGPIPGRLIYEQVRKKKKVAYTTVLTVLDRLAKKGLVKKNQQSNPALFSPAISRQEFQSRSSRRLMELALTLSPELAVSNFFDLYSTRKPDRAPDKEEIEKIVRLLKELKDGARD